MADVRPAVYRSFRTLLARLLMLAVALGVLIARDAATPADALIVALACASSNGLLWAICRHTATPYDPWTPFLDLLAVAALVSTGGGPISGLVPLFIVPAAMAVWSQPPSAVAGLVVLSFGAMAAVAPPATLRGALDYLIVAATTTMVAGMGLHLRASDARGRPDLASLPSVRAEVADGANALPRLGPVLAGLLRADAHVTVVYAGGGRALHLSPEASAEHVAVLEAIAQSELAQSAVRARKPLTCERAARDERIPVGAAAALGCQSVMAAPVYSEGALSALVILAARAPGAFDEGAAALCQWVLDSASRGDTLKQLVREMPEPAVLIDSDGRFGEHSAWGRVLLEEHAALSGLALAAAEAARETGRHAIAEGADGAEGWRADAFPPVACGSEVLVRLHEGATPRY